MGNNPRSLLALDPAVHPAADQQQLCFLDPAAFFRPEAASALDKCGQRPGLHHGPFAGTVRPFHPRDASSAPERPLSPAHLLPARLLSQRRQAAHFTGQTAVIYRLVLHRWLITQGCFVCSSRNENWTLSTLPKIRNRHPVSTLNDLDV